MSLTGHLEVILTKKAGKIIYPLKKRKYLIGRYSIEEIQRHPKYYNGLPDWTRRLIDEAESSIVLKDVEKGPGANYISRAQCFLEPDDGYARIIDLKSHNRTYVNGKRIQSNEETYEVRYFYPGDTVSIGAGVVNLKYQTCPALNYKNHALFAGWGENATDLELIRNNADALKREIVRRGFAGNIEEKIGAGIAKKEILEALRKIGEKIGEESVLLFYFAGKSSRGRSFKLQFQDGAISAKELFGALNEMWCQKLFIMDGPHTADIGPYEMPPRSVLIGNRAEAGEGEIKSRSGEVMGYLTRAVCKALEGQGRLDVHSLVEGIKRDGMIRAVKQEVAYHRQTRIVLPSEMRSFF
ncbi:MAG: FHA domain-containing protein [Pseudomonadota bacterium]